MLDIKITAPDISEGWHQYPAPIQAKAGVHDILDQEDNTILFVPLSRPAGHGEENGRFVRQAPTMAKHLVEMLEAHSVYFPCESPPRKQARCWAGEDACPSCQMFYEIVETLRQAGYKIELS
jgi:hypothetical protein